MTAGTPTFEEQLRLTERGSSFVATIHERWTQGRSTFGGLTAAIGMRALRRRVPERPLASVDIAFIGPVGAGEVEIEVDVLREGKHVTHASAQLRSGGAIAARAHGVYGAPRESQLAVDPPPPSPTKGPEEGIPLPYLEGMTPTFSQYFDFRFTEGDIPFTRSQRTTMGGWVRAREPAGRIDGESNLVVMTDAWPSPVVPRASRPIPASSVRMNVQALAPVPADFDDYWWFRSELVQAGHGYATLAGMLYAGQTAVAWTEQLVAYFD